MAEFIQNKGNNMPKNDPMQDTYNPPSNLSMDFEEFNFGELEQDELFWLTNNQNERNPYRKTSQNQGVELKTQMVHNFTPVTKVYQKTQ